MSEIKRVAPAVNQPAKPPAGTPQTVITVKFGFSEGLNFGCGFFVAGFVFSIVVVPVTALLISLLGMGLI